MRTPHVRCHQKGAALLAVLWLVAVLSAIAFTVAHRVRAETERTTTATDSVRAYYIATGAIERAILYMYWGPQFHNPDGSPKYYAPGTPRLNFTFPSGVATVEIIPEAAKLNINYSLPKDIFALLVNLGVEPTRAEEITAGIVDWRSASGQPSPFDQFYAQQVPSFRARHASLQEIEELLLVKGVTPQLFYGGYTRTAEGQLVATTGLRNCVSPYGSIGAVDVNTAEPAVLATVGLTSDGVAAVVQRRQVAPFRNAEELQQVLGNGGAAAKLRIGGSSMFTLRATARILLPNGGYSDLSRTVSALIKFREPGYNPPVETLRWYEN